MHITFVCAGNTCRSPIAEAMYNARNLKDSNADSCGLSVFGQSPASSGAVLAAAKYGLDITGHKSRQVSDEILKNSGKILCMTSRLADILKNAFPEYAERIGTLAGFDIPDPFGGGEKEYDETAKLIYKAVEAIEW